MRHPLESIPAAYRKPMFLAFLCATLILFAVFRALDQPLRMEVAPNGIVSFELAGTPQRAQTIVDVWNGRIQTFSDGSNANAFVTPPGQPFLYNAVPIIYASFGLGIDYLFMPLYALALAFGTLLASQKHASGFRSLGALAGYGAFAAVLFDAVENFALLRILLGNSPSNDPAVAAFCASVKFGLLVLGLLYCLIAWIAPSKRYPVP